MANRTDATNSRWDAFFVLAVNAKATSNANAAKVSKAAVKLEKGAELYASQKSYREK